MERPRQGRGRGGTARDVEGGKLFEVVIKMLCDMCQIQWSGPDKDVGVAALPVTWKVSQRYC